MYKKAVSGTFSKKPAGICAENVVKGFKVHIVALQFACYQAATNKQPTVYPRQIGR